MYYIKRTTSMCKGDLYPYVNETYFNYQFLGVANYTKDLEEATEFETMEDAYKAFKGIQILTDSADNYIKYSVYEEETEIEIILAVFHKEWKTDYYRNSL